MNDLLFDSDTIEVLKKLYHKPVSFFRKFIPDLYYAPFSPLHKVILEVFLTNKRTEKRKRLVLAPRGLGKSSIAYGVVFRDIIYARKKVIVYFSNSLELAELQTENIKRLLANSEFARKMRGDLKAVDDVMLDDSGTSLEDKFSKKCWVAFGQTLVMPRGMKQQIRGFNWRGFRPDRIIMDDPEKKEDLLNENTRTKIRDHFFGDICKSGNPYLRDTSEGLDILYIDTLKHDDALPIHLAEMDDWHCEFLSVCDPNTYESLVPALISTEEVIAEKERLGKAGHIDVFYREYMNVALPPEYAIFKREYFHPYDEIEFRRLYAKDSISIVLADPGNTTNINSCDTAIVGVSLHKESHQLFVRDIDAGKYDPATIYDKLIEMADRIGAKHIGIETNGPKQWITTPFRNYLFATGRLDLMILELPTKKDKDTRIKSLQPWYRSGYIKHNKSATAMLEQQLLSFRPESGGMKDIMDALAHITDVMTEYGEFFIPPPDSIYTGPEYGPEEWDIENDDQFYEKSREACLC